MNIVKAWSPPWRGNRSRSPHHRWEDSERRSKPWVNRDLDEVPNYIANPCFSDGEGQRRRTNQLVHVECVTQAKEEDTESLSAFLGACHQDFQDG